MKYLSTSALAKNRELESKDLFYQLKKNGWIYKKEGDWHLTKEGKIAGGDTKYNPKFGEYVVWPLNLDLNKKINFTVEPFPYGCRFHLHIIPIYKVGPERPTFFSNIHILYNYIWCRSNYSPDS